MHNFEESGKMNAEQIMHVYRYYQRTPSITGQSMNFSKIGTKRGTTLNGRNITLGIRSRKIYFVKTSIELVV